MLRLSESSCGSKGPNLTLALKDRRPLLPGQDVALMTVFSFAGVIGLTCVGLVIFNWKLQQGRANERTSKNLCCRTLNESLCAREARNGRAVGYCNCHLAQENETEVTSDVGSRKETPLIQENTHQAMLSSEPTALGASFRKLKGRDHRADRACSCLGDALQQAGCQGPPGNKEALCDAGLVTRCCPERAEKLSNLKHGEVQSQSLPQPGTITTAGVSRDTFRSKDVTSASTLARESLGEPLTKEPWQPSVGKPDGAAQPPGQRLSITSASSRQREPGERALGRLFHRHRAGYDDDRGLSKQSKPTGLHARAPFACKYVSWKELQDYMKEKRPDRRQYTKSEKEQIQINRAIEKFLRSGGNQDKSRVSAKPKRAYSTKRVEFHDPHLVCSEKLMVSAKPPASRRQPGSRSRHPTALDLKNCPRLGEVQEARGRRAEQRSLKEKRTKQSHGEKAKGRSLRMNVDLPRFGKARVHPEGLPAEPPKRHKQTELPPEKRARTERKFKAKPVSCVSSQSAERSCCAKLTCSKVPLESSSEQTTCQGSEVPLRAGCLPVANPDSIQDSCCPAALVLNGSSSTVPQPTVRAAEHQHSHLLFPPEQMENAAQLEAGAPRPFSARLGNVENRILPRPHSGGVTDRVVTVSMPYTDQDKLKASELNPFALSHSEQVTATFSGDHGVGDNGALQKEEQKSSREQLGREENPSRNKPRASQEVVGRCVVDGPGTDTGDKIPPVEEDCGSSPPAWTQPHHSLPFTAPHPNPQPNRAEVPRETHACPLGSHALGHLHGGSERGPDTTSKPPRDNGRDHGVGAPGTQAGEKEQKHALGVGRARSTAGSWMARMGTPAEVGQPWEGDGKEKPVLSHPSSDDEMVAVKDSVK